MSSVAELLLEVPPGRPELGPDEETAVLRVLRSGMLAQGPEVAAFEAEFAAHVGGRACVAVSSGTSALHLGLTALGIGRGDEVIVPSFSFAATANAVALTGARPVFADIRAEDYALDPDAVAAAVGPRTSAIVPVHLYGHPAPMPQLTAIARTHGLAVVEDAAQAHLARLGGRPVGTLGDVAAFSFYPTKNMTAGEGGMVVCADDAIARTVRLLRNQGMLARYANEIVGHNARMSDLHAAIGRVQLARLPERTAARRRNAEVLLETLPAELERPAVAPGAEPVWHQFTVRRPGRDAIVRALGRLGIPVGVYYPTPIHRLPAYDLTLDLPATDAAAAQVFSLPVHPALTPGHLARIAEASALVVGARDRPGVPR